VQIEKTTSNELALYLDDTHETLINGELLLQLVQSLLHVALGELQITGQQAILLLLLLRTKITRLG